MAIAFVHQYLRQIREVRRSRSRTQFATAISGRTALIRPFTGICATFVRNPCRYGNFPRPARLTWRPRLPYDDARRMLMARALDVVIGCGGRAGT